MIARRHFGRDRRPTDASPGGPPTAGPVLVLGAPRSGAAALSWALGQHPELRALHGAGWMTRLCLSLASVEAEGRRVDRTRSTISTIGHLAQGSVGSERFWQGFGAGIEALLGSDGDVAGRPDRNGAGPRARGARRWVSAEPELDRLVHALALLFPDARFIHVVRSPEDAVAAMTTQSRSNPRPLHPADAATRWIEAVGNGLDAEAALGSAIVRVEHEAMAADPGAVLERCFEHVQLPWHDGCLRPLRGALRTTSPAAADGATANHGTAGTVASLPRGPEIAATLGRLLVPGRPVDDPTAVQARQRLAVTLRRHAGLAAPERSAPPEVRRCRELVERCVPGGATVAVVSKGDDALLDLRGITGLHLPQAEGGVYAGHHPGSSVEAIAQLQALRDRGAGYVVVPAPSSWWLDHYGGLREHLVRHGRIVGYQADVGVVFELGPPGADRAALTVRYEDPHLTPSDDLRNEAGGARFRPRGRSHDRSQDGRAAALGRLFRDATDQFVIWADDAQVTPPEGWPVRALGRWWAASHPGLPVRELLDRHGDRLGFLFGVALAPGLGPGRDPIHLDLDPADGAQALDPALYRLAGRWACLVDAPWGRRVHLDAGGTLAAVHATDQEVIASTTSLLRAVLEGPGAERPAPDAFPADRENQFFPGGLTHLPWARRVLPNHHLDLGSWSVHRHWPAADLPVVDDLGLVGELQRISAGLGTIMSGLAGSLELHLGLTAGRDSRVLLACGHQVRGDISTFTFDYGADHPGAAVDVAVARELARIAGVPHQVIPVGEPTAQDRADYLFTIGHAGHWGKARDFAALGRHRRLGGALLPGFLGGLGRGHYWSGMPKRLEELTPEVLLGRLRLPTSGPFLQAVGEWRAELPEVSPRLLLDLLYLEHRGGSWAGPHLYGAAPFTAVVAPYASRQVLGAMFRLPHEYRAKKRLYEDLVRVTWPELLDLPFQALPPAQ